MKKRKAQAALVLVAGALIALVASLVFFYFGDRMEAHDVILTSIAIGLAIFSVIFSIVMFQLTMEQSKEQHKELLAAIGRIGKYRKRFNKQRRFT